MSLGVKTAIVMREGSESEIPVDQVLKGDEILIRPGDIIPVDGKVKEGLSTVNESMITGEPMPVMKQAGDELIGGTINGNGSLRMLAEKVGRDTMLSRIIQRVKEAQGSKAPVQKQADRIAGIFVPIVLLASVLTFLGWWFLGPEPSLTYAFITSITVLIISCPCALGLATPTAIIVGIGKGAEMGILIKDARSLEIFRSLDVIVLDKTGTITEGRAKVTDWHWANHFTNKEEILSCILSSENLSEHPVARAIGTFLETDNTTSIKPEKFENISGQGIKTECEGVVYLLGNARLMQAHGIALPEREQQLVAKWIEEAKSVNYIARNDQLICLVAVTDPLKADSADAVYALNAMGYKVHMITGDHPKAASRVAKEAGILYYKAQMTPEDKLQYVKELQAKGLRVGMTGDGINDAPALAQADVGIALGTGTDVAMETAEITLVKGSLEKIVSAAMLSRRTMKTIRQNLFWAFFYNLVGIPVAAGLLFPFFGILLNPMIAGAAMAFSSVSVVTNSLRLHKIRLSL